MTSAHAMKLQSRQRSAGTMRDVVDESVILIVTISTKYDLERLLDWLTLAGGNPHGAHY